MPLIVEDGTSVRVGDLCDVYCSDIPQHEQRLLIKAFSWRIACRTPLRAMTPEQARACLVACTCRLALVLSTVLLQGHARR